MTREIKFRAFNEINKCWTYLYVKEKGKVQFHYESNDTGGEFLKEWQQYTGLKDKNGTEIYEGDVVQLFYGKKGKRQNKEICDVYWREHGTGYWPFCQSRIGAEFSEIIGNIYENPNLLHTQ